MHTVYITKYALTKGIIKTIPRTASTDGYIYVRHPGAPFDQLYREADYALNESEAQVWGEDIRIRRIASLKKQIAKLEKLEIKIVEQ